MCVQLICRQHEAWHPIILKSMYCPSDYKTYGRRRCDAAMLHRSASVPLLVLKSFLFTVQFFHINSCANTCDDRLTVRNAIYREKNLILCATVSDL
jgi:hypothetical protein